ncbi:MAG: peptidylprolyl isomerase [Acidobacteriota bacterium]|nr:peptidylprolyl isomerase [Acidobacteriota bacterium]
MKRNILALWTLLALALPAALATEAAPAPAPDAALAAIDAMIAKAEIDKSDGAWRVQLPLPAKVTFTKGRKYFALMKTNKGSMKIELLPKAAPMHVTNFIYLARLGFYDGLAFHRVIPGFMAQGGCPLGNGRGGPGYRFAGETKMNVRHDRRGVLSTANTGRPRTDGSQFFIIFKPTPWLDGKHTVFGRVVDGFETLDALERAGTSSGAPREPLQIDKVTILVQ